jgi:hypothetical protein
LCADRNLQFFIVPAWQVGFEEREFYLLSKNEMTKEEVAPPHANFFNS